MTDDQGEGLHTKAGCCTTVHSGIEGQVYSNVGQGVNGEGNGVVLSNRVATRSAGRHGIGTNAAL